MRPEKLIVERASLPQVMMGINGRQIPVDNDVFHVVERLREIDPGLFVNYIDPPENSDVAGYFTICGTDKNGDEYLVTTVTELTPDVVEHIRLIGSEGYDAAKEADRMDDAAKEQRRYAFAERVGEIGERLHHALRKDFSFDKDRIWVPGK